MSVIFGRLDVDETAETVPYVKRVVRTPSVPVKARARRRRRTLLLYVAAFAYFAFAAWTALGYLIRELG